MDQLKKLFTSHEAWLTTHVQKQAKDSGFAESAEAHGKTWETSVSMISDAITQAIDTYGLEGCQITSNGECGDEPIALFAVEAARRHRERGVSLAMFMGMLKFYRRAYISLIRQEVDTQERQEQYRTFVSRFFDRVEIAQCVNWTKAEEQEKLTRGQTSHHFIADEKNRFQPLFESLPTPVFMLDINQNIEIMNRAAAEFLGDNNLPIQLGYAQLKTSDIPAAEPVKKLALGEVIPWLADPLKESCSQANRQHECRFDVEAVIDNAPRHFNVAVSNLSDFSDTFTGTTVILDDITSRVEMGRQLAQERNRATHYLDIVGSIVVVLEPSGSIMLINRTGCTTLGYEESELLGQNWIDLIIPEEQRDEIHDHFYMLFSGKIDIEDDDEHINYVTTKKGEHRLISWKNRILTNDEGIPIGILSSGNDITEQRQVEEDLAEKELWLRNTFVALGEAVLILTPDRMVIDANPAAETMFGMTNEEFFNISVEELHVDHGHYLEFEVLSETAFAQDETADFEFTMRRKSGEKFPSLHSVSLITGDDGAPLGIVNVIRDISHRKEAERVLKQSEEKFRRIFESIEEGYLVADLDGTIQMVNPATCNLLGYTESDLIGKDMGILYATPKERARLKSALATKGKVRGFHLNASHRDGSNLVIEANAHVVRDQHDNPIAMEGTFRDITARIEAEKILREREKQYRAFFENNHAIMLLVDPKTGDIMDANPAASNFYGYSVDEMRDMNISRISAQPEEDIYQEMFKARQEKRVYFIFQHRLANGDIRDVEVYSGPIMVQGNQFLYSIIHDVTERMRLEKKMTRMATTDALTGAANRHQFFQVATTELKRSHRYGHQLSVLMLDIDYFKSINDTYGHQTGDVVLRALTAMAQATLRATDVFGRIGGEEFAAILPETPIMSAMHVAERLREKLSKLTLRDKDKDVTFTVSIGVSIATKQDKAIEDVINRADEALYKAKRTGRNKVEKA